jgi:hypothetical protein
VRTFQNFTGFGLYDRQVVDYCRSLQDPYPYFRGIIAETGLPTEEVHFHQPARKRGITKNNFYKFGVEAVAKYVYNKPNFIEKHMGLSDNEHELHLLNKSIENGAKVEKLDKKFLRVE